MLDHLHGKTPVYEAEYRIRAKDGRYRWYYDRGKVTRYDADGKPVFLSGIVFDITEKKATQVELEEKNKLLAKMSELDGLTRISNHRALVERLKSETERSDQKQTPLAIAAFPFGETLSISVSGGVQDYRGQSTTELIHEADMKMYQAKRNGKNQIVI